jgi:predicted dehydrogenase
MKNGDGFSSIWHLRAEHGTGLALAMRYAPTAELVAICDQDKGRLVAMAEKSPILKTYTSWRAMLDSATDAVVAATSIKQC